MRQPGRRSFFFLDPISVLLLRDACASSSSSSVALMGEISRFRVDVDAASRHTTTAAAAEEGEREAGKDGRHHNSTLP